MLITIGASGGEAAVVFLGCLAVAVGSAISSVGIVAAGVRVALRWEHYDHPA